MKKTLIIILHLYGFVVYGQNTSTIIQLDVCMGETITLAPENILSITWDNGSTEHTIVEQITSNTTFSALVVKKENNLTENGDFELGNSLFSSSYSYWPGSNLLLEGMYHVSDNPQTSHSGLVACTDHTTGSENMAIYNGASSANVEVWSQTIDVEQNTEYALSAWIQKINGQIPGNPAMLQFKINGVLIGDIFRTSEIACEWDNFYEIWNSETNTQATISIVNQNTAFSGNDFAIDDISFSKITQTRYIYEITAIPLPEINIGNDTLVCENYTIDAGVDFDSYLWNNNSTNQTLEVSTTGIYSVEVSKNNCTSSDEIEITVSNPFILNLGNDTTICENTTISIYLESADSYLWNDGTSNSAFSTSEAGIYSVTLTRGACSSSDTIEIFVQPLPIIDFGQTSITKCEVDSVEINCGYSNAHYLWNTGDTTQTIKIKNEGTYFITVTDNNCEEFGTIQVINIPSTYPSISIGVSSTQICEGESINIYISDSSNLGLNPNIILLKNGNTFPFTNNSSIENIANNDIFRLIATSTLECSIYDTVSSHTKITVIETPVPQTNINNQRICEYETPATFTAIGSNIKWYQVYDTTTTPIHTGANYTPTINTPGNYKFYATQTQNMCQSNTAEVNFNVYQKPESIIIDDNKGCEFSSHTLKISSPNIGGNIVWFNSTNEILENTNEIDSELEIQESWLQVSERTQFKAIVVNQHNCISDTASAYYELIQIPSIPETIYFNQYHCKGNSTDSIVVFSFADNIQWYKDSIYYPIYEGNIFYPTINNEDDNNFIAVASNQSMCFSPPLEFKIQVVELPKSKIIGKNKVCEKTYKQIYTIDSIQKGDVINWNVSGNYLTTLSNTNKTIYIDFDNPGIDTLTLTTTSKDGCINIDTLVFKIAPKPEAYFTWSMPEYQQNVVFENQSIQDPIITTDTTIYPQLTSYWNYGREKDLFENLHSNQQFNRFDTIRFNHGKYEITLKVVNDYGCEDEIKNNIFIDIFSSLYIPNSFSPSSISEGIRTFTPKGMNLSKYEMYIYDAWGNLLFYTDKLSKDGRPIEGWDGTYQNEQMPSDIYFWKIEASFRNNSKWQGIENNGKYYKYGNLVLIR